MPAALAFLPEPQRARPARSATGEDRLDGRSTALLALLFLAAAVNMIAFYMIPTQLPFYLAALGLPAPSLAGAAIAAGHGLRSPTVTGAALTVLGLALVLTARIAARGKGVVRG